MAGADYISCNSTDIDCKGSKLIYAGDIDEEFIPVVYCEYCYNKLLKKYNEIKERRK